MGEERNAGRAVGSKDAGIFGVEMRLAVRVQA